MRGHQAVVRQSLAAASFAPEWWSSVPLSALRLTPGFAQAAEMLSWETFPFPFHNVTVRTLRVRVQQKNLLTEICCKTKYVVLLTSISPRAVGR